MALKVQPLGPPINLQVGPVQQQPINPVVQQAPSYAPLQIGMAPRQPIYVHNTPVQPGGGYAGAPGYTPPPTFTDHVGSFVQKHLFNPFEDTAKSFGTGVAQGELGAPVRFAVAKATHNDQAATNALQDIKHPAGINTGKPLPKFVTINGKKRVNPALIQKATNLTMGMAEAKPLGKPVVSRKQPVQESVPLEVTNKNSLRGELGQAIPDKEAPIINYLKDVQKQTGKTGLVDQFYYDTGLQRRSNSIANAKIQNSENLSDAFRGLKGGEKKTFDSYVAARQELSNAEKGLPTSVPVEQLQQTVAELGHHEPRFQALSNYYKEWADELHNNGIIDDATHQNFVNNNDYTRIQRVMDDLAGFSGRGGNSYSLGSTFARQKRTGSERAIQPADQTAFHYAQQVQQEIQRNQTASNLIDVLESQGHAKNLVNADDVAFRRDMWRFLHDTREGKQAVGRLLKTHGKQARQLQTEVDRLNKEGMNISLGKEAPASTRTPGAYTNVDEIRAPKTVKGRTTQPLLKQDALTGTVTNRMTVSKQLSPSEVRKVVENLITKDPKELTRIKNKLSLREPRLKALIDDVEQLRNTSEAFSTARKEAYNAAVARADQSTLHKNTLKRIKNGITEVYEVPRDVKELADNISPWQLGILGRIVSAPQRLLRAGATGLSLPFTAANYVKDQASSAVFSKDVLATHAPHNVFSGLYQSAKDFGIGTDDALWQKFIAHAGDTTSYDFIRNTKNSKMVSREVRLGQGGRAINKSIHPIRTLEDLNQVTEKATRYQNFRGVYNKVLKQTGDEAEATKQATLAAWQNSTDFSRMGHVSQALNLLIPYFNAGVQGTRLLVRRFGENPAGTTMKTIGIVGLPLTAITLYNLEDEKRKAVYDNISDYEKQNNIIVVLPNAKQEKDGSYSGVIKVPLQRDLSNLVQPLRMGAESFARHSPADVPKMAQQFFGALAGPINTNSASAAEGGLVPQAVKPFVQQVANKDFFTGKKIVPDYIQQATDANGNPVPESKKAYPFTSGTAQVIGKATGTSPIRVDKFIKDTTGKIGEYTQNAVDNALAKAGKIPKDQIGGISAGKDVVRRFERAQSKVNFQKSEGAKHFDDVNAAQKKVGLTGNELAAWNSIHPSKTNFLGDATAESTPWDAAHKADTYVKYPQTFAVDKAINDMQTKRGMPSDPKFALSPDHLKTLLAIQSVSQAPGNTEGKVLYAENKDWLDKYYKDTSAYFDKVKSSMSKDAQSKLNNGIAGLPARPQADEQLTRKLDVAKAITDSAQKRQYYADNPDITDYFAKSDSYNRAKRAWGGFAQFDQYPTPAKDVQKLMDYYNNLPKHDGPKGGSKTRSLWIQSHPKEWATIGDQYDKISQYSLEQDMQIAQYEGHDLTDKGVKALSSLGGGSGGSSGSGSSKSGSKWIPRAQWLAEHGFSSGGSSGSGGGSKRVSRTQAELQNPVYNALDIGAGGKKNIGKAQKPKTSSNVSFKAKKGGKTKLASTISPKKLKVGLKKSRV